MPTALLRRATLLFTESFFAAFKLMLPDFAFLVRYWNSSAATLIGGHGRTFWPSSSVMVQSRKARNRVGHQVRSGAPPEPLTQSMSYSGESFNEGYRTFMTIPLAHTYG